LAWLMPGQTCIRSPNSHSSTKTGVKRARRDQIGRFEHKNRGQTCSERPNRQVRARITAENVDGDADALGSCGHGGPEGGGRRVAFFLQRTKIIAIFVRL